MHRLIINYPIIKKIALKNNATRDGYKYTLTLCNKVLLTKAGGFKKIFMWILSF